MNDRDKEQKKPTGKTGPLHVSSDTESVETEWKTVDLPTEKDEIEKFVLRSFLQTAESNNTLRYWVTSVSKNDLDDFDFSVQTTQGPKTIELMEIAPLEDVDGGYEAASGSHDIYEFGESIAEKILAKSARYESAAGKSLILLTYVTDWKFWPSPPVISLVQYWMLQKQHVFEEVHLHIPAGPQGGISFPIFPTPEGRWEDFDPEQARGKQSHNLDPDGWRIASDPNDEPT